MRYDLPTCVHIAVNYRQTKLFITGENLYRTFKTEAYRAAEEKSIVELDIQLMSPDDALRVFEEAGRSGEILVLKATNGLEMLERCFHIWHKSGGWLDGTGEILRKDGTTVRAIAGFCVLVWVTPSGYSNMPPHIRREVFPPKDAYHFLDNGERDWEIFKPNR